MASFPSAVPLLPAPMTARTAAEFLAMFDRILSPEYLEPLKSPGPGYELLQAIAKVGERLSLALEREFTGQFVLSAGAGAQATCTIAFSRPDATHGAVTVKAGTIVTTDTGRDFALQGDVAFGAGDIGPLNGVAVAIANGWEWNVPGPATSASGEAIPGSIDTIRLPLQDPPYGDPTITVAQVNDATGGADDMLPELGHDRGIDRLKGEDIDQYRLRVTQLPDTVSPDAIARTIEWFLSPYGLTATVIETWETTFQTAYDAPGTSKVFFFDDTRPQVRDLWLDQSTYRGAFIVVVPKLAVVADRGMFFDDTAMGSGALKSAIGSRSACFYDVPITYTGALQGFFDGFDSRGRAIYKGLFDVLDRIKAAGVWAGLLSEG
jgi:hypothetical protein